MKTLSFKFLNVKKYLPNHLRWCFLTFGGSCLLLAGCSESSIPDKPATKNITHDYYGLHYQSPAVTVNIPGDTFWVQEIVSDFKTTRRSDEPDSFSPVVLDASCRLPRPSSIAEVTFIEIYGGRVELPLHFIDIPYEGERLPQESQTRSQGIGIKHSSQVKRVDVFITDVQRPVYLLLSSYEATLWVLYVSEKVNVEGVAVVGHEGQAITNVPPNTKVGFVVSGPPQRECWNGKVARPVDKSWEAFDRLTDNRNDKTSKAIWQKVITESKESYANFQSWLRWHIGHPDTIITAYGTSHILVGPKPKIPLPYQSLKGQKVLYTPNVKPMWD